MKLKAATMDTSNSRRSISLITVTLLWFSLESISFQANAYETLPKKRSGDAAFAVATLDLGDKHWTYSHPPWAVRPSGNGRYIVGALKDNCGLVDLALWNAKTGAREPRRNAMVDESFGPIKVCDFVCVPGTAIAIVIERRNGDANVETGTQLVSANSG